MSSSDVTEHAKDFPERPVVSVVLVVPLKKVIVKLASCSCKATVEPTVTGCASVGSAG